MEERYKKYIEKAKSVIKTLDPKVGGPEVTALRSQINEKDRLIETLEHVGHPENKFSQKLNFFLQWK